MVDTYYIPLSMTTTTLLYLVQYWYHTKIFELLLFITLQTEVNVGILQSIKFGKLPKPEILPRRKLMMLHNLKLKNWPREHYSQSKIKKTSGLPSSISDCMLSLQWKQEARGKTCNCGSARYIGFVAKIFFHKVPM